MKAPVFTGTCTALITPFRVSGEVDYDRFAQQIQRQLDAGVDALCVCGTTGEGSTLTDREHRKLVAFCKERAGTQCPVLAGAGSNDTGHALDLCKGAQDAGADALLVVTPYYNKATQTGLIRHYEFLADRVAVPVILYNVPSRTGLSFTAETYAVLSRHPNINGIKEASGDLNLVTETLGRCGEEMTLWSGNDDQALPLLALGGRGLISVAANLIPGPMTELTHAFLQGDLARARELQITLRPLLRALFLQVNPVPVKAAMELAGWDTGVLRMPLCAMDEGPKAVLRQVMGELGLGQG